MNPDLKTGLIAAGVMAFALFAWKAMAGGGADASEAKRRIAEGALVIDVRSAGEYASGHLDGAVNIPHQEIAGRIAGVEMDKARPIVVYCLSGGRSAAAVQSLRGAGYTNVVNGGAYRALKP